MICLIAPYHERKLHSAGMAIQCPFSHFNQVVTSDIRIAMKEPVDSNNSQPQVVRPSAAPTEGCWRSDTTKNDHHRHMGKWETPFFGCFKDVVYNCLKAYFCSCVTLAQISARLGYSSYKSTLITLYFMTSATFVLVGLLAHETYMNESSWEGFWSALFSKKDYSTAYRVYSALMVIPAVTWFQFLIGLWKKSRERSQLSASSSFGPPNTLPPYPQEEQQ